MKAQETIVYAIIIIISFQAIAFQSMTAILSDINENDQSIQDIHNGFNESQKTTTKYETSKNSSAGEYSEYNLNENTPVILGESVKTVISYPALPPSSSMTSIMDDTSPSTSMPYVSVHNYYRATEAPGGLTVRSTYDVASASLGFYVLFVINVGERIRAGSLVIKFSYSNIYNIDPSSPSVFMYIQNMLFYPTTEYVLDARDLINADGTINILLSVSYDADTAPVSTFEVIVDKLYYKPNDQINDLRSSYSYVSSTQLKHTLIVSNEWTGANISIFAPMSWNFSTVNPIIDVIWNGSTWIASNIPVGNYEFTFLSGDGFGVDYARKPQLLAIQDYSSDYVQAFDGFEDGSFSEWQPQSGTSEFSDLKLDTSIVFEGSFSLVLDETLVGGYDSLFMTTEIPDGYYYVSFAYYIESPSATTFTFSYATNGGSATLIALDQSITNRWVQVFYYVHLDGPRNSGGWSWWFGFEEKGDGLVAYIDNFRIYKASTSISTTGLNQYSIQGVLRSWDNRQNPPMPNSQVQIQFRDRTANSLIAEWQDVKTDSSGAFSVTYTNQLQEKEYEIRVFTLENSFGDYFYEVEKDISDFNEDVDNWVLGSFGSSVTQSDQAIYGQTGTATRYLEFRRPFTPDIDSSKYYYLAYEVWTPTDYSDHLYGLKADSLLPSSNYFYYYGTGGDILFPSDMPKKYVFDLTRFSHSGNTWDGQTNDWMGIVFEFPFTGTNWEIYLDNIRIYADGGFTSTFFTPLPAGQSLYTYEENQEWDFSEGTKESLYTSSAILYPQTDGTILIQSVNRVYGSDVYLKYPLEMQEYNSFVTKIIVRLRTNATDQLKIGFFRSIDWHLIGSEYYIVGTSWQTFEIDVSSDSDFTGATTHSMFFKFRYVSNGTTTGNEFIWLDFIRLVHTKISSLSVGDSYAYSTSENNSLSYAIFSDNSFAGYANDLETILANMTMGSHNLTLIPFSDSKESFPGVFFPNYQQKVEFLYDVVDSFVVSVESFSLSDSYVSLYVTATKSGTYKYYFDNLYQGSGSLTKTGTAISIPRDQTPGKEYELEISFENGSDTAWFNVTISNPAGEYLSVEYFYYDVNDETFSVTFGTTWGNQTAQVFQNGTLLGTVNEDVVTVFDRPLDPGKYFNITVQIAAFVYQFGFKNAPKETDAFQLLFTDFSYDTDAAVIYFSWSSNWGNTSAYVYDNSTLLGSGLEESIAVKFISSYGLHNITISLYSGSTWLLNLTTGFTIAKPAEIFEVSIDLFDAFGLGLEFSTVAFYHDNISDSNRLPKQFLWPSDNITILAVDYWGYVLWNQTYSLNSAGTNYIRISVPIYQVSYVNPYNVSVSLNLERGSGSVQFIVPANSSIQYMTTKGEYRISASPIYEENEVPAFIASTDTLTEKAVTTLRNYQIKLEPVKFVLKQPSNIFDMGRLLNALLITGSVLGAIYAIVKTWIFLKRKMEGKQIMIETM